MHPQYDIDISVGIQMLQLGGNLRKIDKKRVQHTISN